MVKAAIVLVTFLVSLNVYATADGIGRVEVPFSPPQVGESFEYLAENWNKEPNMLPQVFCMTSRLFYDHISSSSFPAFEFLVSPFNIPSHPGDQPDVQINSLADGKIKVETTWEKFHKYDDSDGRWIHEPEFTIDVSGYDQSTKAGRLEAITMAKLAIIALHFNLAEYGYLFRLTATVNGLPQDQSEFSKAGWTRVYPQTQSPYSKASPLAQSYYQELFATDHCQEDLDKAKKIPTLVEE